MVFFSTHFVYADTVDIQKMVKQVDIDGNGEIGIFFHTFPMTVFN
jgi:hypothetical protein